MGLKWTPDISTGNLRLDEQHKTLFNRINELEENIKFGNYDETYILNLIKHIKNYTESHFKFEEVCMKRHQCPMAEKNKDAHAQFIKQINDLENQFEENKSTKLYIEKIHSIMRNWWLNHICRVDISLKKHIKN